MKASTKTPILNKMAGRKRGVSSGFFFSRFFRVSGSENTLVPWVFSRNPWVFSRNSWVFWNFLEFFHKLLNFLQIFSEKVVRHWQNLNYIPLIHKKNKIPRKNVVFQTYMAKNLCFYWVFGWDLLKLLWLLEFLAEKVLEFFHGLSFFRLEFFGYREKKSLK